jgi:hypothetical protein
VIQDDAAALGEDTGLLVWTLASADFSGGTTGVAYYAVTLVEQEVEDTNHLAATAAVAEGVADPLPVRIETFPAQDGPNGEGGAGHVMIQYMDLRNWNPTFHAPHERNGWYGLDNLSPAVTGAIQYAYDYVVVEPFCATASAPLYLSLHGWDGNTYAPRTADPDAYSWCAYKVFPVDVSETWFLGFARDCDYRTGALPGGGDAVVNFTEQRILRMVFDTLRHPPGSASVDTNRVYVFGGSMGGSGALALALRYPNVFAAAYASQPMTDYRHQGDYGGTPWRNDVEWKWGTVAQNLPMVLRAPADWADHLQAFAGTGVWDWQNHQRWATNTPAREKVPLGIGHGTNDYVIEWPSQGRPVYPALDGGRLCWGGSVTDGGHSWMGFNGLPQPIGPSPSLAPFQNFTVVKNEPVAGWSDGSANAPLPPDAPGSYFLDVEWSASWMPWAGAPVDATNRLELALRSDAGELTLDVTPRRLDRFPHEPMTRVLWRNIPVGSNVPVQAGTLAADAHGLYTVTGFLVTATGNRLVLQTDESADSDGDGMPDYWEAAHNLPTNSPGASADSDGDGQSDADEYRAGTDPRATASHFAVETWGGTNLSWQAVPGFAYAIESAPAVTGVWQSLAAVTAVVSDVTLAFLPDASTNCFHRVRKTAP